jgi:hypothetical protein
VMTLHSSWLNDPCSSNPSAFKIYTKRSLDGRKVRVSLNVRPNFTINFLMPSEFSSLRKKKRSFFIKLNSEAFS